MPDDPIPDFAALLDTFKRRGVTIEADPDGRIWLDAPAGALTPEATMQARRYRDLLAAGIAARRTGHQWAPCTHCRQPALLAPAPRRSGKQVWPRCYLTPGCPGRHMTPEPSEEF